MWSLKSPRAKRISGPKKFHSSPKKDFFNNIRQQRSFHNRSFGEPLNNQPIADDQSMIRRVISVGPISTALTFCRTAEAPQHSMLGCYDGTGVSFFSRRFER
jgi:hypothetical protein